MEKKLAQYKQTCSNRVNRIEVIG